jgi:hypothetical protein
MIRRVKQARVLAIGVSLMLLAIGCRDADSPTATAIASRQEPAIEKEFSYAELDSRSGELPMRYSAALPNPAQAAAGDWSSAPPPALVTSRLCRGDVAMQAKVLAAVRSAIESGAGSAELRNAYEESLFGYCGSHELCSWLVRIVDGDAPDDVKWLFWHGMRNCEPALVADTFARADAPSSALLSWFGTCYPAPSYDPRVVSALREQLPQDSTGPHTRDVVNDAVATLAQMDDPRALEFVEEAYRDTTDRELRRRILSAMAYPASEAQVEFVRRHCADIDASMCDRVRDKANREPSDVVSRAIDSWEPVDQLIAQYPDQRTRLLAALELCARGQVGWKASGCLANLASQDRARAVELVRAGIVGEQGPMTVSATLVQFPEPGSLEARLDAIGFSAREHAPIRPSRARLPGITAIEILIERGYVHEFDAETDMFPNQHEILMDELVRFVSPDLDGVTFEEMPPQREHEGYELIAYMDGERHSIVTQALGDWYDLQAVVGMLNSLARKRGVPARFITLPTTDQTAYVLGASKSAILTAIREEIIHIGDPATAMQLGTGFEAEVMRQLAQ